MTLLAPAAFVFAAVLAVPILVHLLKPRRVRQTPFSSLRWLAHSPQKLSRRIRPHQLLLFAMRAGFLLLLVFALTRPLLSSGDSPAVADRVIVVDVSRSMALRVPGKPTPIERAREIAANLIESAPPGTRTTVLLVGNTARRLGSPDRDASVLLPELRAVEATAEDTNLVAALPLAKPLLARASTPGELVFITDNRQGAWDADAVSVFAATMPNLRVRVIDVGSAGAANGWVASARVVEVGEPARRLLRIELAAFGEGQDRTLRVTGIPGEGEAVRAVSIEPGRPTVLHLEPPAESELRGKVARVSLEPADALADDDEFFVSLDARASLRVLVIEPDTTGPEALRPGFALRTAVKALTDSGTRAARVTRHSPATVSATAVNEADVIVLADVPDLPESVTAALVERVRGGAGLAVFPGLRARPDWYNQNLHRPLQPAEGLLPLALGAVEAAPGRVPWVLSARPPALLAGLGDPLVGDLAEVSSGRYRRLDGSLPVSASVIARTPDGTPLVVEHRTGAGAVLLVNATPDDSFSDLPRSKAFVPLVDRMLATLGRGKGRAFMAGQSVALPLDGVRPGDSVTLVGPAEERRSIVVRGEAGGGVFEVDPLARPGMYRVEPASGEPVAFAVNAGRGDSVLSPLDAASLKGWWQPLDVTIEVAETADKPAKGPFPLWPALLLAAALLLAIETFASAWLCPRLAPAATTSLIQKQRLNTETPK